MVFFMVFFVVFLVILAVLGPGTFLDLLDVRTDVGHRRALGLVLAVAALVAAAPSQHYTIVIVADTDVVPAIGAIRRAGRVATTGAGAADIVAAVVVRLRRVGE